ADVQNTRHKQKPEDSWQGFQLVLSQYFQLHLTDQTILFFLCDQGMQDNQAPGECLYISHELILHWKDVHLYHSPNILFSLSDAYIQQMLLPFCLPISAP